MSPRRHVRGTLWNLAGQGLPLIAGIFALPVLVRHLGEARFGVLGLIWATIGYFSILDLGLGRGTTKFVAQALSQDDHDAASRVATLGVLVHAGLGLAAGAVVVALTPVLVPLVVSQPTVLVAEARSAFYLAAASLPLVLLAAALRAVLEAARRFDVTNLIRIPSGTLMFVVPAVTAALGAGLGGIVASLLAVRMLHCVVTLAAIPRAVPGIRWTTDRAGVPFRELARYSGWVGAANLLNPFLHHFDRFLLGAVRGTVAVAHYTAPFEVVTRMLILPGSAATTLFPSFSALPGAGGRGTGTQLVARAVWTLAALMAIPTIVLVAFAGPLLGLWLGPTFAGESGTALRILALGVFVNGLAHVPYIYLQGVGRPDLPTKFLLLELPLYVVAAWLLVGRFGVAGAAGAWTLRVTLDAILVFGATYRVARGSRRLKPGSPRGAAPTREPA